MIPSEQKAKLLWGKYNLPQNKRIHVGLVAAVAGLFAKSLIQKGYDIDSNLVRAAALLHDIDKNVPKLPGEQHPQSSVRILKAEGMDEVADLVARHSLHFILDDATAPRTWEEKILFLSDKMVKYDIVGVDKRFALWRKEQLPDEAVDVLKRSYPKVKALEKEMFSIAGMTLSDLAGLATEP